MGILPTVFFTGSTYYLFHMLGYNPVRPAQLLSRAGAIYALQLYIPLAIGGSFAYSFFADGNEMERLNLMGGWYSKEFKDIKEEHTGRR